MDAAHPPGPVSAARAHRGRLAAVFGITVTILTAEIAGGLVSGSLVLLADAGHLASDAAGMGLALLAVWFAGRPATSERTFGYQRAEILAAVANAVLLFGLGGFILVEAVRRLVTPPQVDAGVTAAFGVLAVVGSGASLIILRPGQRESLTVRGAFLEVAADLLGAISVVVAAAIIATTGFRRADALAALLIGVFILPRTARLLREAVDVLLEATPKGVDLEHVRAHIRKVPGVVDVHDLHAWTITSGVPVLSAHVVVDGPTVAAGTGGQVLDQLGDCLAEHFDVEHCTFQLEPAGHQEHERGAHP